MRNFLWSCSKYHTKVFLRISFRAVLLLISYCQQLIQKRRNCTICHSWTWNQSSITRRNVLSHLSDGKLLIIGRALKLILNKTMQMTENYTSVALGPGDKGWLGTRIPRLKRNIKLDLEYIKSYTVSCDLERGLSCWLFGTEQQRLFFLGSGGNWVTGWVNCGFLRKTRVQGFAHRIYIYIYIYIIVQSNTAFIMQIQ